jgi:hypothetical protein
MVPSAPEPARPWGRWPFALVLVGLIALTLAFPLYQAWVTGGYLYYENGPDENSYLQYHFSRLIQGPTRSGQYLVTLGHTLGLSGGYLNMLFDAVIVGGFALVCRATLRRLGWTPGQADVGALSLVVLPQAAMVVNPVVSRVSGWILNAKAYDWLNPPFIHHSPLLRSPEPQVSLMLVAVAAWAAVRWRSIWVVYAVLPFLYPFVAIPVAFVAIAYHLRTLWRPTWRWATAGPLALSALAVGIACLTYYTFLLSPAVRMLLVASHLPLLSITSVIALALYAILRRHIAESQRFLALAVAIAPMVASNQQVLSGNIPQPSNFEHSFGCVAVAVVAVLGFRTLRWWRLAALAAGSYLFFSTTWLDFRMNQYSMGILPLTPELLTALKEDSAHTVVNNVHSASVLNMVHPRQESTALALERTWNALPPSYAAAYRCIKGQILQEHPKEFAHALGILDGAYEYSGQPFFMLSIGRRTEFKRLHSVDPAECQDPARRPLRYFFVTHEQFRR